MKPIKKCATFGELCKEIGYNTLTDNCRVTVDKAWNIIHSGRYKKILVSVSGGADSDIMLDLIERIGYPDDTKVEYIWFNTGMEYEATKRHLDYLEEVYGIKIERIRAKVPVPLGCQKYGLPFVNKAVSDWIHILQNNNFRFEDKPYAELLEEYPKCKSAVTWFCDAKPGMGQYSIRKAKWLREFLIANPPKFSISKRCCTGAKKSTAHEIDRERAGREVHWCPEG